MEDLGAGGKGRVRASGEGRGAVGHGLAGGSEKAGRTDQVSMIECPAENDDRDLGFTVVSEPAISGGL